MVNYAYPRSVNLSVFEPLGSWESDPSESFNYDEFVLEGLLAGGGISPCPPEQCYASWSLFPVPITGAQRPQCCVTVQVRVMHATYGNSGHIVVICGLGPAP